MPGVLSVFRATIENRLRRPSTVGARRWRLYATGNGCTWERPIAALLARARAETTSWSAGLGGLVAGFSSFKATPHAASSRSGPSRARKSFSRNGCAQSRGTFQLIGMRVQYGSNRTPGSPKNVVSSNVRPELDQPLVQ